MQSIVNIAAYKFVALRDLGVMREELRDLCRQQKLKGTILLSSEGINLFTAGVRENIDCLLAWLRGRAEFADIMVKESFSDEQPFNRMLVKVKREIIAFRVPGIEPAEKTSPRISPRELKRWLDEGRPVTLLDTRNTFEVEAGTFENAVAIGVDQFTDFPAAAKELPVAMKSQPVVTFCTGGIRCEKAAPLLENEGFEQVYQLDGGILNYFEECGGEHYQGDCFVFDKRVALNPSLQASGLKQCFVCQTTLTEAEQASPKYVESVSCPHCFVESEDALQQTLMQRRCQLQDVITPLPGLVPYVNERPLRVSQEHDGKRAIDVLDSLHTQLTRERWLEEFAAEQIQIKGRPIDAETPVVAGQRLIHIQPGTREPDVNAAIEFLYEDEAIVVVSKPAPLPMHPCGRFNRNTLIYLLRQIYHPIQLRPIHRLDADTSGVVVLCKSRKFAREMQSQFSQGTVEKEYVALALGNCPADDWTETGSIAATPGDNGVRLPDADGLPAETTMHVIARTAAGDTLLRVQPLTGRSNQIRIHLWQAGHPIVGDPIYLQDGNLGAPAALAVDDSPLHLHAWSIGFQHPQTGQAVTFQAELPDWAKPLGDRESSSIQHEVADG